MAENIYFQASCCLKGRFFKATISDDLIFTDIQYELMTITIYIYISVESCKITLSNELRYSCIMDLVVGK